MEYVFSPFLISAFCQELRVCVCLFFHLFVCVEKKAKRQPQVRCPLWRGLPLYTEHINQTHLPWIYSYLLYTPFTISHSPLFG